MSYQDVLAFVQENPVCFISTIDGDQPRVRGFLTVLFNDGKLYFTTGTMKSVYRQLSANPNVELCYCSKDFQKMLRIAGKIEIIEDREKKQQLLNERDYLKSFGGKVDDPAKYAGERDPGDRVLICRQKWNLPRRYRGRGN